MLPKLVSKQSILIIDDENALCEFIGLVLTDKGYTVHCAANGTAGLRLAYRLRPHLILLEARLPIMEAAEFIPAYRQAVIQPAPIILMTAPMQSKLIQNIAGVQGFLSKPFELDSLLLLVNRLIKQ